MTAPALIVNPVKRKLAADEPVLRAIVAAAREHGLEVMVHAVTAPAMRAAVNAGAGKLVHTPHGSYLSATEAARVAAAGIEPSSLRGALLDLGNGALGPLQRHIEQPQTLGDIERGGALPLAHAEAASHRPTRAPTLSSITPAGPMAGKARAPMPAPTCVLVPLPRRAATDLVFPGLTCSVSSRTSDTSNEFFVWTDTLNVWISICAS